MNNPMQFPKNDGSRLECQIVLTGNKEIGTRVIINKKMLENAIDMIDGMSIDVPVYERMLALYMPVQSTMINELYDAVASVLMKHDKESKDLDL